MQPFENVAVLIPCYNEEITIAKVIIDFSAELPGARIYVFDNNSLDRTAELAKKAGALVIQSPRQGKGNVVRHMFSEVDADYYIMVDGDDTYPAFSAIPLLRTLIEKKADMVVGTRVPIPEKNVFRRFHRFGNGLVTNLINLLFQTKLTDVLSGYRVFSERFVKTIPLVTENFEIETEITLQAVAKRFSIFETPIEYGERPPGSTSKLNTYSDGFLILKLILMIFKDYKPLVFFSAVSILLGIGSLLVGSRPIIDYFQTGLVPHIPRAILASGIAVLATICLAIGLILDSAYKYHNENFELWRMYWKKQKSIKHAGYKHTTSSAMVDNASL